MNVGGGRQRLIPEVRDCGRIIWDNKDVVAGIWERVKESVEKDVGTLVGREKGGVMGAGPGKRGEVWGVRGLNERMRVLRYEGGEYFRGEFCPFSLYDVLYWGG